jgi:hypothetical protein
MSNLEKYGVEYVLQVQTIRDKGMETSLTRYGVKYPLQNIEIFKKSQNNSVSYTDYTLPSGKTVKLQGYEKYAMDILLKQYKEDEIKSDRQDMPEIWYEHSSKKKRYFTDFYIPKDNLIIEVKSIYTYQKDLIKNICKALFTRKFGYKFEFWIIDKQGKILYVI